MKNLLQSFEKLKNLPIAKTIKIKKEEELNKLSFPYYMKASISGHKLEEKAVLRCENIEEAKNNLSFLKKKFFNNDIVIQEQVIGTEMIIGLKQDSVFEKLLLIGFGGTNAEILKDIQFLATPVSKKDIQSAVERLKLYPTLYLRKKHAIDKFIELAYKVSQLDIKELDLNPVILNEDKAVIVDARLED
jgi:acetate---CoA ligase (ADP-forming)